MVLEVNQMETIKIYYMDLCKAIIQELEQEEHSKHYLDEKIGKLSKCIKEDF